MRLWPLRDGEQMLTYSLGFLKVQGAAYHSIKNYRAVVHKSQNFNREQRFVGHSSNMRTLTAQFKPIVQHDRDPNYRTMFFSRRVLDGTPLLGIPFRFS